MTDQLSDAELVATLKMRAVHTPSETAKLLGIKQSALRTRLDSAKAKGLTVNSEIVDEVGQLRARLKIAERALASAKREEDTAESIRRTIYGLAEVRPAPTWLDKVTLHKIDETFSVPMAFWSDWHWGEVVRKNEVGGVNEFNRKIAKLRLKRLVSKTIDLTTHHMGSLKIPGIVVILGGDMISGNIHEELRETNEGTVQECLIELQDELTAALQVMADRFGRVHVPCVVGNHGRTTMKPRAKGKAFENYEWNLYQQLERFFRNDNRFTFQIPDGPDCSFTVLGHRFMLTHGDTLGVKGGDGIIGAIGPISRGAFKIGRSQAQVGANFDTLMMGHWHTYIPRGEASPVIVNGTLKGYDEYAHTILRVPYSQPSQALWFVHAKHGITAQWQVFLEERRQATMAKDWLRFPVQ